MSVWEEYEPAVKKSRKKLMENKTNTIIIIAINIVAIMGMYGVVRSLVCDGFNCILPYFAPNIFADSMMYGLPIASIYMLFKKKNYFKIIGIIYAIGFITALYLLTEALI